jgi:hypothetical protein
VKISERLTSENTGGKVRTFLFFLLLWLYLWLKVDLRLIYHAVGAVATFPAFFRGWDFFREFLLYPGGLVEYISAFFVQFFYHPWAGAAVVAIQLWLICFSTDCFLRAIGAPRLRWVRFIPLILLLITYNRYTCHFTVSSALFVAILSACLYVKAASRTGSFRLPVFLILSAVVYIAAGGAYFLFALLCIIYEMFFKSDPKTAAIYLATALAFGYVGGVIFYDVSIADAYTNLTPLSWKILQAKDPKETIVILFAVYLLLPIVALAAGLWQQHLIRATQTPLLHKTQKSKRKTTYKRKYPLGLSRLTSIVLAWYSAVPRRKWAIQTLTLLVVAAASVRISRDIERKAIFEIDYYACNKMWPQVLERAPLAPNNYFTVHAVNRALYHTGRLGDEMFRYRQNPNTLLLTMQELLEAYWKRFDVCLDLGLVNLAEHELIESLGTNTERPAILERLALVNLVKGDVNTARVYLTALDKTLFHAGWANKYLAELESDPNLETDSYIQSLRTIMADRDGIWVFGDNEKILQDLLAKNKHNKMAFEYLMAWYLLTRQLDKFVQNVPRLDDFKYDRIPRHYEEALLLYSYAKNKPVDTHNLRISSEARQRFARFNYILGQHRSDTQAARQSLARDYADTYFFYHVYGFSGIGIVE